MDTTVGGSYDERLSTTWLGEGTINCRRDGKWRASTIGCVACAEYKTEDRDQATGLEGTGNERKLRADPTLEGHTGAGRLRGVKVPTIPVASVHLRVPCLSVAWSRWLSLLVVWT